MDMIMPTYGSEKGKNNLRHVYILQCPFLTVKKSQNLQKLQFVAVYFVGTAKTGIFMPVNGSQNFPKILRHTYYSNPH